MRTKRLLTAPPTKHQLDSAVLEAVVPSRLPS